MKIAIRDEQEEVVKRAIRGPDERNDLEIKSYNKSTNPPVKKTFTRQYHHKRGSFSKMGPHSHLLFCLTFSLSPEVIYFLLIIFPNQLIAQISIAYKTARLQANLRY